MSSTGFEKIAMTIAFGLVIAAGLYLAFSQTSVLDTILGNKEEGSQQTPDLKIEELPNPPQPEEIKEDGSTEPGDEQTPDQTPQQEDNTPKDPITVNLGEKFQLAENQVATLSEVGMEIVITNFIYSPCPDGAACIWSGMGIHFEYRLDGQVEFGINKTTAFGYEVEVVRTNYRTYAELIVRK